MSRTDASSLALVPPFVALDPDWNRSWTTPAFYPAGITGSLLIGWTGFVKGKITRARASTHTHKHTPTQTRTYTQSAFTFRAPNDRFKDCGKSPLLLAHISIPLKC